MYKKLLIICLIVTSNFSLASEAKYSTEDDLRAAGYTTDEDLTSSLRGKPCPACEKLGVPVPEVVLKVLKNRTNFMYIHKPTAAADTNHIAQATVAMGGLSLKPKE